MNTIQCWDTLQSSTLQSTSPDDALSTWPTTSAPEGLRTPDVPVNSWALSSSESQSFPQLTSVHVNSSDELMLASGYSSTIRLYDLATGQPHRTYSHVHSKHINIVRFANSTPHLMASCSFDKYVKLWDLRVPGATPAFTLPSNGPTVMIAFSQDDLKLLVSGVDNDVTQFDVTSGRLSLDLAAPRSGLDTAYTRSYYGNGGDTIVTANSQSNQLRYHSAVTGDELGVVDLQEPSHCCTQYVQSLRGSPHTDWEAAVLVTSRLPGAGMALKMVQWDSGKEDKALPPGCYARQGQRLLDALACSNGQQQQYLDEAGQLCSTEPPGPHIAVPAAYERPIDWPDLTAALRGASIAARNEAYQRLKTHFTKDHLAGEGTLVAEGPADEPQVAAAAGPAVGSLPPPPPPLLAASSSCLSQGEAAHTAAQLPLPPLLRDEELSGQHISAQELLVRTDAGCVCVALGQGVLLHVSLAQGGMPAGPKQFDCQIGLQGSPWRLNAHLGVLRSRWQLLQSATADSVFGWLLAGDSARPLQLAAAPLLLLAPAAVGPPAALAMALVHTYSGQLVLTRVASAHVQAALAGGAVSFPTPPALSTADGFQVAHPPTLHRWQCPVNEAGLEQDEVPVLSEASALSEIVVGYLHSTPGRSALGLMQVASYQEAASSPSAGYVYTPAVCSSGGLDVAALCAQEAAEEAAALQLPPGAQVGGQLYPPTWRSMYAYATEARDKGGDDVEAAPLAELAAAALDTGCMPKRPLLRGAGDSFALRRVRVRALIASVACVLQAADHLGCPSLRLECEERLLGEVEPRGAGYLGLLAAAWQLRALQAACIDCMLQCPANHCWGSDAYAEAAAIKQHLPLLASLLTAWGGCQPQSLAAAGAGAGESEPADTDAVVQAVAHLHTRVSDAWVGGHFPSARDVRSDLNRLFTEEWDPLVEEAEEHYTQEQMAALCSDELVQTPFTRHAAIMQPAGEMQVPPPEAQAPPVPANVAAAIANKARPTSHDGILTAYGASCFLIAPGKLLLLGGVGETGVPAALDQGHVYDVNSKQMMSVCVSGDVPATCSNAVVVPLAIAPESPHASGGYRSLVGAEPSTAGIPQQLLGCSSATDTTKWSAVDELLDFNGSGSALGHRFAVLLCGQHPQRTEVHVLDTLTMQWTCLPSGSPQRPLPTGRYLGSATLISKSRRVSWEAAAEQDSTCQVVSQVLLSGGVLGRWDRPAPPTILTVTSQVHRDGSASHSLDWLQPFILQGAAQLRVEHSCTFVPMGPEQASRAVIFGGSTGGAFLDTAISIRIPQSAADSWESEVVPLGGMPPTPRGLHSAALLTPNCIVVSCGARNMGAGKPCNDVYTIAFSEAAARMGRPAQLTGVATQLCSLGQLATPPPTEDVRGTHSTLLTSAWRDALLVGDASHASHVGARLEGGGGDFAAGICRNVSMCPRVRAACAVVSPLVLETPPGWTAYNQAFGEDLAALIQLAAKPGFEEKCSLLLSPAFADALSSKNSALAALHGISRKGAEVLAGSVQPGAQRSSLQAGLLHRSPVLFMVGGALHIPTRQGQLMSDSGVYSVQLVGRSHLTGSIVAAVAAAAKSPDTPLSLSFLGATAASLSAKVHTAPFMQPVQGDKGHDKLADILFSHMNKAVMAAEQRAVREAPFQHAIIQVQHPLVAIAQSHVAVVRECNHHTFGKALLRQQEWSIGHDMSVLSDDGQRLSSSGWLLQRACQHFSTLIGNSAFKEADSGQVRVPFAQECAQYFLSFVHTGQLSGELHEDPHALLELLQAAASISLESLVVECESRLIAFLDVENCLGLLQAATDHHCVRLQEAALAVALKDFRSLKQSPDWEELPQLLAQQLEDEFMKTDHIHSIDRLVPKVTANETD